MNRTPSITGALADAVIGLASRPRTDEGTRAAERTLANIVAVAIGASRTPGVQRLARHLDTGTGVPLGPSPLISERGSPRAAALLAGFAGHYDDYDDTHLATVIHPAAACFGAAWAVGRGPRVDGALLMDAFAIGCEIQLRLGLAVSPEHYDRGWHITGTCGVIGATVTAALLRGLSRDELATALAIASVRTLGHREAFGTELKPFHAGQAAANAVSSVDDASGGSLRWNHEDDPMALLLTAFAPRSADPATLLTDKIRWELDTNAIKPYPCGIVAHPGIDAGLAVHQRLRASGRTVAEIVSVRYRCHPLVPELMGRTAPDNELEARFSAVHGVAAGLLRGTVGLAEFDAGAARSPEYGDMRSRITMVPDARLERDQAELAVDMAGGDVMVEWVEHARGSIDRPLTDDELRAKADALLELGRGPSAEELWRFVTSLPSVTSDPWRSLSAPDRIAEAAR
ncbi:MmgE/PrpD family protein [Phytoactinopolyspora alkaliphila]|uniref:MmgE/PrpD family protein n=1 Tax=Phytoactinopolyspora alkaliphila TaxID=1783498 RepID=A0A6N9YK16_9ACTN|nr:MmgE/PrpD family protein [Phytoactinopolyspora alkaliphila]